MAAGVVVVAYDRGCIREMVEAPHVVAADFDELERAVRTLLLKRPSREEVCEKYRFVGSVSKTIRRYWGCDEDFAHRRAISPVEGDWSKETMVVGKGVSGARASRYSAVPI